MADSALRSNPALHAKLTRYSTFGSQSRKYKTSGAAKPPSKRTRILAFGKASQPLDQTAQDAHCSCRAGGVPRTQHRGDQILLGLLVKSQEPHHRQVAVGVVMPIEKRQLLRAMCGIVSRIQIDGDQTGATLQSFTMSLDYRSEERRVGKECR